MYLYFNQQVGKHNQLPTMGIQIQEMPVSSAIMSPWAKQVVVHGGERRGQGVGVQRRGAGGPGGSRSRPTGASTGTPCPTGT